MIQKILENCYQNAEDEAELNAAIAHIVANGDKHEYIRTNHISWSN